MVPTDLPRQLRRALPRLPSSDMLFAVHWIDVAISTYAILFDEFLFIGIWLWSRRLIRCNCCEARQGNTQKGNTLRRRTCCRNMMTWAFSGFWSSDIVRWQALKDKEMAEWEENKQDFGQSHWCFWMNKLSNIGIKAPQAIAYNSTMSSNIRYCNFRYVWNIVLENCGVPHH